MTLRRVFLTRRLPAPAVAIATAACDVAVWDHEAEPVPRATLLAAARESEGLLTMTSDRIDAELVADAPSLRVVANMAVGYDNVDLEALTARGILLTNTPDVLTETTADLAWALILATSRRVVEGQRLVERGEWRSWSPMFMVGPDVHGATLGVLGAGRIGGAVLRRGAGFGMALRYSNRGRRPDLEASLGAEWRGIGDLFAECDIVVITAPLTAETRGIVGSAELAAMKPTSILVNVARGPIVQETALIDALTAGRPWGAGLDVFDSEPIGAEHPLLAHPRVIALPHIGSASTATRTAMAVTAARNLVAALTHGPVPNPVNAPIG